MPYEIITIALSGVNCYLLKTGPGFIMIDTGFGWSRRNVERKLVNAGCKPGDLKLVIITHADSDHTGSCVFLKEKYGAKIAIHASESKAAETGDMLASRRTKQGAIFKFLLSINRRVTRSKFKPDVLLNDGDDLSTYGLNAKAVHTPGHTIGSVSILTAEGDFFCGDFLNNAKYPKINSLVDDKVEMAASVVKMKALNIKTVYPGHGKPFAIEEFWVNNR